MPTNTSRQSDSGGAWDAQVRIHGWILLDQMLLISIWTSESVWLVERFSLCRLELGFTLWSGVYKPSSSQAYPHCTDHLPCQAEIPVVHLVQLILSDHTINVNVMPPKLCHQPTANGQIGGGGDAAGGGMLDALGNNVPFVVRIFGCIIPPLFCWLWYVGKYARWWG